MKYKNMYKVSLLLVFITILACSCASSGKSSYAGSNTGDPMVPTRHINRVVPPRKDNTRYLDSNKKKKKKWTKIKPAKGSDCPWREYYSSSAEKKIEKKLNKKR